MSNHHKLSLKAAILININIMLGAGLFINTTILAQHAGMCGALSYALIGILMLPLIGSIMQLVRLHPSGGFYTFGSKELHPFAGFISTWAYATGKLASSVIMIHSSMLFLQQVIPNLLTVNPLWMDALVLIIFIMLNMFDIKTSSHIQSCFLSLKLIPVLFGIFSGLLLWLGGNQEPLPYIWTGIPFTLPLVLFAIVGFEAACSLSIRIKDAHHNAPRAIMISYFTVIILNTFYQLMISGSLGTILEMLNYREVYPTLFGFIPLFSAPTAHWLTSFMHLAIISSALGGSYGIIFSNNWNWYTLAQHRHLWASERISDFNRYHIPWICVLIQGAFCFLYLIITKGSQLPLQQIGVLGVTISYTISILSLLAALRNNNQVTIKKWIPPLAFGNCLLLLAAIMYSLVQDGIFALLTYGILLLIGIIMFFVTPGNKKEAIQETGM